MAFEANVRNPASIMASATWVASGRGTSPWVLKEQGIRGFRLSSWLAESGRYDDQGL